MALKIKASSFFTNHTLEVNPAGVTFIETTLGGGKRKFRFEQIELVLMSPGDVLSFQVGREVFSIPTNPKNKSHQEVINALLEKLRRNAPPPLPGR